ncbi:MAG: MBL fold metallo-hydrolase [Myxococcota bacterium]
MTLRKRSATALAIATALLCSGCDLNKSVLSQALRGFVAYFDTPASVGSELTRLSDRVWTYHWYFDRTLIVQTDAGLVVVDPFNPHMATHLRQALVDAGIEPDVHTLLYTHYHVDHTRGGAALAPRNVVCHVRCDEFLDELPAEDTADVLRPTRTLEGDQRLEIGGVRIDLVALPKSHTDTMYAVHLPDEGVLFAADTVGLGVMLPAGGVSIYMPAYLAALDRLQGLDFEVFVSSHFGWGDKAAYVEAADLQRDGYRWAREALARYGTDERGISMTYDEDRFLAAFSYFYDRMKEKYGDWHGFDAMILSTFTNQIVAVTVGN